MKWRIFKSKKILAILRSLLLTEVLVYLIFMGLALAADWGEIYKKFFVSRYVPFEIVEFSFLGFFQLVLIVWIFVKASMADSNMEDIIRLGEHERSEFKASFRWDTKRRQINKDLEKTIMKTITAFLNSDGGHLFIGVNDQGIPMGLENDFASLPKQDMDGFENHFNNIFNQMIGPEFRRLVKLSFNALGGKTICMVSVEPSHNPAYLKNANSEDFYIRTGNVTTPLKMSEVAAYLSSWHRK